MKRELIKDYYGKILGSIETDTSGNKVAKDYFGLILGFYDKKSDTTQDRLRHIIARGDSVVSLVFQHAAKK